MAKTIFVADNTIPGQSAAELHTRAIDAVVSYLTPAAAFRSAFRAADRNQLRDIGLDRDAS